MVVSLKVKKGQLKSYADSSRRPSRKLLTLKKATSLTMSLKKEEEEKEEEEEEEEASFVSVPSLPFLCECGFC